MKHDFIIEMLESLLDPKSSKYDDAVRYWRGLREQALPCLIGALGIKKYSTAWPEIINIIRGMRTSSSISALIPILFRFLKDSNKPIYNIAFDGLKEMGDAVIYEARDILAYNWSDDSWVQNTCALLLEIESVNQEILIPDLVKLISIGTKQNPIDEPAFSVLCNIKSPKINAVIPLLANKFAEVNRDEFKIFILENLPRFDKNAIRSISPSIIDGSLLLNSELLQTKVRDFWVWLNSPN